MHKYNNQDHSMYTAMLTVENMFGAHHDIWSVNVEEEYHEAGSTGRDAPVLPRRTQRQHAKHRRRVGRSKMAATPCSGRCGWTPWPSRSWRSSCRLDELTAPTEAPPAPTHEGVRGPRRRRPDPGAGFYDGDPATDPDLRLRYPCHQLAQMPDGVLAGAAIRYLLLGFVLWIHAWAQGATTHTLCGCGDPALFLWFFQWPATALAHGQNPFFSTAMFHPGGINLLAQTSVTGLSLPLVPVTWIWGPVASLNVASTVTRPHRVLRVPRSSAAGRPGRRRRSWAGCSTASRPSC